MRTLSGLGLVAAAAALAWIVGLACSSSSDGGGGTTNPDAGTEGGGSDGGASGPGTSILQFDANQFAVDELRVDGTSVFYKKVVLSTDTFKKASIEKIPIAGGAPVVLAADLREPSYLVVDDAYVYFARRVCNASLPCGVFRVAKDGGAVETLAQDPDGGTSLVVTGMAVDDTYVYFGASGYDSLFRVNKDGSASIEVVSSGDVGIRGVQVDAQYVYWVDATVGNVKFFRLAKNAAPGTAPDTLATLTGAEVGHTPTNIRAASMTDTEIVWADCGDSAGTANSIVRLSKTQRGATTPVKTGLHYMSSMKVFGSDVFYSDGNLEKLPLAGGTPTMLAGYPVNPTTVTPIDVDATGVYWITLNDIRRLAF